MCKVNIIGNKRRCYSRHLYPIRVFKKELIDYGLDIKYFPSPASKGVLDCDTLIFLEASYREILPIDNKERKHALEYLTRYFENFKQVIWFDDHDSSGMLRIYVLPIVNKYGKSQLLSDRGYYQENHLMGIPHRDFVNENYKVNDSRIFKGIISTGYLQKICVSWNLALVNWSLQNSDSSLLTTAILKHVLKYPLKFTPPVLVKRPIHVSYRANMWQNIPTVNWWRTMTNEKILEFIRKKPRFTVTPSEKVGKNEYSTEMRNTLITPSPFGIGEICYRDFECFMNGSLLFKPNMDHLLTWPDLYIDGVTYISHKWDFSDFNEKLEDILSHPEQYEDIAREGQNRFRDALSDGHAFAQHFKEMISA